VLTSGENAIWRFLHRILSAFKYFSYKIFFEPFVHTGRVKNRPTREPGSKTWNPAVHSQDDVPQVNSKK
jgi:hypothetical protein